MTRASVYLRPQAARDLEEIGAFIGAVNPLAALQFLYAAEQTFEQLARRPMLGRARHFKDVRLKDLRSWRIKQFPRFLVFYRPVESGADIVRILHVARDLGRVLATKE
jgi:toxin ParE1/3/4